MTPQVCFNNIPAALRVLDQWLLWKYLKLIDNATGEVSWTKPPYQANGNHGSTDNPRTWTSLSQATDAYNHGGFAGVGFVLTVDKEPTDELPGTTDDGLSGVDLDHCVDLETGTIEPWAQAIVDQLDSYTETSPSNTGLRIFLYAKLPPKDRKIGNFETYESGRYLTVTGNHLPGTPLTIEHRQDEMIVVHTRMFAERNKPRPTSTSRADAQPIDLDDAELLEIAFSARNGDKVRRLYQGDISGYPGQSEADMALISHLCFYSVGDPGRIDRLFRSSDLMRPKWDEMRGAQTYGDLTIGKVVDRATDFYQPDRCRNVGPTTVKVYL